MSVNKVCQQLLVMIVDIQIAGICRSNMTCSNTKGSYKCECEAGYENTADDECIETDECATNSHSCGRNSKCSNTIGFYECNCDPGYELTADQQCSDTDECKQG